MSKLNPDPKNFGSQAFSGMQNAMPLVEKVRDGDPVLFQAAYAHGDKSERKVVEIPKNRENIEVSHISGNRYYLLYRTL